MTLDILLEEIKYGKDFIKSKKEIEGIQTFINEDKTLMVSKRVDQLLKECDSSQQFAKKLSRASRNYKEYEDRKYDGKSISSIYVRMKIDSITEDINSAILELENKKVLRESNQEYVGKAIAILKYGIEQMSADKGISFSPLNDAPGLIESYLEKESTLIESII